jgi:tetratricopeptide (TPR) repeat protein
MQPDLAKIRKSPMDLAWWEKAKGHLFSGQYRAAVGAYGQLLHRYPAVAELWFELGNAASGALDFTQANQAYRRALELAPSNARLLLLVGQQYQGLRQLDQARACFERAVAVDPALMDARISLALWFERERRLTQAWDCVQECLAQNPNDDQARYLHAFLLHRLGRNAEAEPALRQLVSSEIKYPYVKYASRHLLGVVLDQLGQFGEALRWLVEAKALVRQLTDTSLLEAEYDRGSQRRRQLLAELKPGFVERWRDQSSHHLPFQEQIAMLGGHPRSGTTLLEQIMDAHPEVLAFDEPGAFSQEVAANVVQRAGGGGLTLAALEALSSSRRQQLRQHYRTSLLQEVAGQSRARVLLDKNPSGTVLLHVWLRVFPELKVIIALRDPRDVVISCYFQNLLLNATNVNFLSLERTARHYADLMDVWLRLRDLGGFDWLETRYEDVVLNLEQEGRRVTQFLGVTWHVQQAQYYEKSRRKFLYAPTYHDVTQPVYTRAVGRWQRYAEALEPLQERLAPYCRAFGYAA